MRKVISYMGVSADGCRAGWDQLREWQRRDAGLRQFARGQLAAAGAVVLDRAAYEQMAACWPSAAGQREDPVMAAAMTAIPKMVVSRDLARASWAGTQIVAGNAEEKLFSLKAQPGKPLAVVGGRVLTAALIQAGLISELRLIVLPVLAGTGQPALAATSRTGLRFSRSQQFTSGAVLLCCNPPVLPGGYARHPDGSTTFGGWSGRPAGWGYPPP